ncbi:MAG: 4Fe-4S binding protein [Bilophila wadsworthia]
MIRLWRLRRLVQVAVLLLLAALPWLNRDGFTGMKGSLFAFDFFGLPFADPLGAVQIGLSGIIPGWRLIAGALVVLAVALCLGRIFCSWFCPFGFLSELVHAIRGRRPQNRLSMDFGPDRDRAVGLALVPLLGFPLLNQLPARRPVPGFLTAASLSPKQSTPF